MKILSVVNSSNFQPQAMGVTGAVVKFDMKTPNGPATPTLVKCMPEPVPDAEFIVPGDYEEIKTKTPKATPSR